jgi:hypothetical protein
VGAIEYLLAARDRCAKIGFAVFTRIAGKHRGEIQLKDIGIERQLLGI